MQPTSRLRVRQEPLEVLHQVVIARRAPVFQQVVANLLERQLTGRRHLGRTDSAASGRPWRATRSVGNSGRCSYRRADGDWLNFFISIRSFVYT